MQRKRIYHSVYARNYETIGKDKSFDVMAVAYRCKLALKERLFASGLPKDRAALAVSLLLGDKSDLDEDVKLSFSVAGLSHILCVSGLHIGLIIFIFDYFLKYIHLLGFRGWVLRRVLLIVIAWTIAFIVGCTPSALRVALMLTLTIITDMTVYRSDRINMLFVTAFLLLLFNPLLLFDIGFQLSFLAVFGIMLCMPKADSWIKRKVPSYLKAISSTAATTLSAQMFVLPIIVYRFKTFPILFLFANILVVPFVGLLLFSIICLLFLVEVPIFGELITQIVSLELYLLQEVAHITENFTKSLFS
jgi:competence protein ComEC